MPRRSARWLTVAVIGAALALVTPAAGRFSAPSRAREIAAPASPQAFGPQAFGVLPAIRPLDGNGLDFNQRGAPPYAPQVQDFSPPRGQIAYTLDTVGSLPQTAPVYRLDVAPATEQRLSDLATAVGMRGPLSFNDAAGHWDRRLSATEASAPNVRSVTLTARGTFSYLASDPGALCGAPTATPIVLPSPAAQSIPATATPTPFGVGTDLCANRGPAIDEARAIAIARDFLATVGFPPDPSYTVSTPPESSTPSVRAVHFAATAPDGSPLVGKEAQRDFVVMIGPDGQVTFAGGPTTLAIAASAYPLRSAADLAATLQAGDAYATLTFPPELSGLEHRNRALSPLAVHVTAATPGYALAYTFDATPYLIPVMTYTGTAATAESQALGKEIGFTAYVDAVQHPAPDPAPIMTQGPLPATPDLGALASYTFVPRATTRAEFDALLTDLGFAGNTVEPFPATNPTGWWAKLPDGTSLSVGAIAGGWSYDSGGRIVIDQNSRAPATDDALAVVRQFIDTHHVRLDNLGVPVTTSATSDATVSVCYPLLINGHAVLGSEECALRAFVGPAGTNRLVLTASSLLVALQRDGTAALQTTPVSGTAIGPQQALDALATGPPTVAGADDTAKYQPLERLRIEDEPENATHHFTTNTFYATRGQAAPNQFIGVDVTIAYIVTSLPAGNAGPPADQLQPVWRLAGQIDIGVRHRIAPFVYLYPSVQ